MIECTSGLIVGILLLLLLLVSKYAVGAAAVGGYNK